jgi:hypothetical protein
MITNMLDSKALKLFNEIWSKTQAGKIEWKPTADESTYVATIGGRFSVSLTEPCDGATRPWLEVSDERGVLLSIGELDGVARTALFNLFEGARRKALNVDEKIEAALAELQRL